MDDVTGMDRVTTTTIGDDAGVEPAGTVNKHSYTIACSSAFRDAVEALAAKRRVNVGDMARSVLLLMPQTAIAAFPDPGEPVAGDREIVILKSGPAQGRPWRRKPRLQVRMAPGYQIPSIRKALAIALAVEKGDFAIKLVDPREKAPPPVREEPAQPAVAPVREDSHLREEIARMRAAISVLAFEPLPDGINSRDEALHVLGFPPGARPDRRAIRARFRMLATIHHPDSHFGNHNRMSQLNQAVALLQD